jgi:hypothetical protein
MPITYGGVTPALVIDTTDLQDTEKLSPRNGKLVRNRNGVCMAMVLDWIKKCHEIPGGVTDKSQLKSGLSLALAQTAYMRGAFGEYAPDGKAEGFIESHLLSVNASNTLRKKRFSFKKSRFQRVATALAGLVGYAQISIFGDGGHALGYRQKGGVIQFFDPNEGILQFNSGMEFAKWFPSYVKHEYPDLLDEIIMRVVRG